MPWKTPSSAKNINMSITKFLSYNALKNIEQNSVDSYSFRATYEGGFFGLFLITKTKVPHMTVVTTFCYQSNWLVASIVC